MFKDLLTFIEQKSARANTRRMIEHPTVRGATIELAPLTEDVVTTHYMPRNYEASSITGLAAIVSDIGQAGDIARPRVRVSVGNSARKYGGRHDRLNEDTPEGTAVRVVFDEDSERSHRVTMPLTISGSFDFILSNGFYSLTQSELVRAIKQHFPAPNVVPETFLPSARTLKWTSGGEVRGTIDDGRETHDARIEAALAQGEGSSLDLASTDYITLRTPVFDEVCEYSNGETFDVRMAVHIDVAERTFTLTPTDGEIVKAREAAIDYVAQKVGIEIGSSEVVIYGGAAI